MASNPITSRQIDEETVETVTDFIFWGSKITADGEYSHEIKRCLLLERKVNDQPRQHIKKAETLLCQQSMAGIVKAMVFQVVMDGCESWTIKKAEC